MSSDKSKSQKASDAWNNMLSKVNMGKNIMKIDSLLGQSAKFKGDFFMTGNIKIDGKVNGEVKVNGDVIIGETGEIKGNLSADNIIVAGTVKGNITAKGQLTIKCSAHVDGEHSAKSIAVEEGSSFTGNCKITGSKLASPEPEPAAEESAPETTADSSQEE